MADGPNASGRPPRGGRTDRPERRRPSGGGAGDEQITEILFGVLILAAIFGLFGSVSSNPTLRAMFVRIFPQSSLSYYDGATGARVYVSKPEGNVREGPGGIRIGSQNPRALGTIITLPQSVDARRFWDVNFDSGTDGWVAEDELLLVKPETFLSRIAGFFVSAFKLASGFLSLVFLTGIIYSVIRRNQVLTELYRKQKFKESPAQAAAAIEDHVNRRWERSLAHVQSEAPADWRLAILEADIMLAELLEKMGYIGENVGEKLKRIEKSDFNTIDDAWEAHKVRNLIAHHGSDYVLSKREAQRVIGLYANVFREFRYI